MKKIIRIFLILSVVGICGSSVALTTPADSGTSVSDCASGSQQGKATFDVLCTGPNTQYSYSVSAIVCYNSSDGTLFKMTIKDTSNDQTVVIDYVVKDHISDLCNESTILQDTVNAHNENSCSIKLDSWSCNIDQI